MKTHPLNVAYLVVGLVFLGIAGSWALRAGNVIDTEQAGWLAPMTLVVAGVVGLVAFAARGASRRRHAGDDDAEDQRDGTYDPTYHQTYDRTGDPSGDRTDDTLTYDDGDLR